MQPTNVAEFPVKGSGLTPLDSSWIRVEALYEALVVKHKWGTQTHKHVNDMAMYSNAQSNKES